MLRQTRINCYSLLSYLERNRQLLLDFFKCGDILTRGRQQCSATKATLDVELEGHITPRTTRNRKDMFTVSGITSFTDREESSHTDAMRNLHKLLVHGNVTCYYETHINLRSLLLGLRTVNTISKIMERNPQLQKQDWSTVTANMARKMLILTTLSGKKRFSLN